MTLCGWITTSIARARHAEQPVRLDHLEALVHHRRRIDGDLAAHHPVRMRAGLVRRDARRGPRAARVRNGPPDAVSRMRRTPARPDRARSPRGRHWKIALCSLSIGSSVAPPASTARMNSGAADHQRFLVGEQDALAGARGGERRREAGGADDRGQHGVDLGQRGDLARALPAPASTSRAAARRRASARCERARGVRDRAAPRARAEAPAQRGELRPIAGARRARRPRSGPDGARRRRASSRRSSRSRRAASDVRISVIARNACASSAASGIAASSASMRSSTPPWPGSSVPLSLTPAWRFSSDSNRSPTTETRASASASATHATIASGVDVAAEAGGARERHQRERIDARPRRARRRRLPRSCRG